MLMSAPEPLSRLYSRAYYRATWVATAFDAGLATAMPIRPKWIRDLAGFVCLMLTSGLVSFAKAHSILVSYLVTIFSYLPATTLSMPTKPTRRCVASGPRDSSNTCQGEWSCLVDLISYLCSPSLLSSFANFDRRQRLRCYGRRGRSRLTLT